MRNEEEPNFGAYLDGVCNKMYVNSNDPQLFLCYS